MARCEGYNDIVKPRGYLSVFISSEKKPHENIVPSYSSFNSKQSNNLGFLSHQVRSNFLHITKGKNVYSLSNVDRTNIGFYLKCSILFIHSIKLPFIIIKRLTEEP